MMNISKCNENIVSIEMLSSIRFINILYVDCLISFVDSDKQDLKLSIKITIPF